LTRTSIKIPALVDLDEVLENSYRDFHAKGFDYLCLRRTPERTVKAYFFEGDVAQAPEVIAPHDHRYSFRTEVLTGSVVNRLYQPVLSETPDAEPYELFDYATPLNGGDGFTWKKLAWLSRMPLRLYPPRCTPSASQAPRPSCCSTRGPTSFRSASRPAATAWPVPRSPPRSTSSTARWTPTTRPSGSGSCSAR
jgi:hypothetical protein